MLQNAIQRRRTYYNARIKIKKGTGAGWLIPVYRQRRREVHKMRFKE